MEDNKSTNLFTLGNLYISDFIGQDSEPKKGKDELSLVLEHSTGAVRLERVVDPNLMYGEYWYRSGINSTMTEELQSIADDCYRSIDTNDGDIWLDIACNDGTLLKAVPPNLVKVGIDPADESYSYESMQIADLIVQDFFSANVYKKTKYGKQKAKIITIIAMFYDIENPLDFLKDVEEILDDEGLLVIQMSYTPLMLKQLAFDNVCHEHVYYYSLTSIQTLLNKAGLTVVDCQLNDVNGGSFRIYARKESADPTKFRTSPFRDVAKYRVDSLLALERENAVDTPAPYEKFYKDILDLREQTVSYIKKAKAQGKTVWGYGASTKGNTLLQWFGLDNTLIDGIAERNPHKFGLKTVGSNIPIYSEEEMRKAKPDYLLILPWHFISEFKRREEKFLENGGKFIVPCPKFEIIGKDK
tara:strand:- start:6661 stop:7902 length:1242 start_codon:yes stop_codon:yes gene_type:complete